MTQALQAELNPTLKPALDFAVNAAWQAGRITLGYFQTNIAVETKSDASPVTVADRTAEQKLRELIAREYPADGIIGEEFGNVVGSSGRTWVLDPIDGTKSFIHGVPLYGVLVALIDDATRRTLVGVAHFPGLNETIYASVGNGCYLDGRRVRTSSVAALHEATILASDIVMKGSHTAAYQRLLEATKIHRTWGDAYGYMLVASGRAEIMLDGAMQVWDCAALQVIMEEAGGSFTDWHGTATIDAGESIGTNGALLAAVLDVIKG